MGGSKRADEEPSRTAGACVLVFLAGVAVAMVFAVSSTAGVLCLWIVGAVLLWRSARRKGTDLALPSPTAAPSRNDVSADELRKAARGAYDPNGVMCIVHLPAEEVNDHDPTLPDPRP